MEAEKAGGQSRRRFAAFRRVGPWLPAIAGGMAVLAVGCSQAETRALADPNLVAPAETLVLRGDRGYTPLDLSDLPAGSTVDARQATFIVANSRNPDPSPTQGCDTGLDPVNRYPLQIRNSRSVTLDGGLFDGRVPLESDWVDTYCNSAATRFADSIGAVAKAQRMRRAWDGIRFSGPGRSPGLLGAWLSDRRDFTIRGAWLSEMRDDCVENDDGQSGTIVDVLFDGCFAGVSLAPTQSGIRADRATIEFRGALIRMGSYLYKGEVRHALPIKLGDRVPRIRMVGSVIALSDDMPVGRNHLPDNWGIASDCRDNLMLWLSDQPYPDSLPAPPACFALVTGDAARQMWAEVSRNWIDCHPEVARFSDDPGSTAGNCRREFYGGQYLDGN